MLRRDKRVERGTELDVAGAYNAVFMSQKRTGERTRSSSIRSMVGFPR